MKAEVKEFSKILRPFQSFNYDKSPIFFVGERDEYWR